MDFSTDIGILLVQKIWLKYLAVYFASMFKFIFGPTTGIFSGLSVVETSILTICGMMTSVLLCTFGGTLFRDWWFATFRRDRKLFSPKSRRMVKLWSKYGLRGVAFLTPILFSPIVGTIVAISFGESRIRILQTMFFSAIFWGFLISLGLKFLGHGLHHL